MGGRSSVGPKLVSKGYSLVNANNSSGWMQIRTVL